MRRFVRRHRKHVTIVMVGVVVLAGLLALFVALRPDDAVAPRTRSATPVNQQDAADAIPVITLPGVAPITAITQDYTDPSSVWVVVSKDYPMSRSDYKPRDLAIPPTSVPTNTSKSIEEQSLRQSIFEPTVALFSDAKKAGHDIMMASGFRSYELQKVYFDNYVRTSGEVAANMFSARPGQSEHQTGIAFDVSLSSRQCYLETCFGDTAAGRWLAERAYTYGFIVRYPADKTDITRYQYEPWHFRYVGTDLARALHDSGLTLDEAYPYLQSALQTLRNQKRL